MIDLERTELAAVRALYEEEKYQEALAAYRGHFLHRLDCQDGLHWSWLHSYHRKRDRWAEPQLSDEATAWVEHERGAPGSVDWPEVWVRPSPNYHVDRLLESLLEAYLATEDQIYLNAWSAFMDDWILRDGHFANYNAADISDRDYAGNRLDRRLYVLRALGRGLPPDGEGLSETTLARYLLRLVTDHLPFQVPYSRSNPQNWTTMRATGLFVSGLLLDDVGFKVGPFYQREGLRLVESLGATQQLPDGVDQEQNLHYWNHYPNFTTGPAKAISSPRRNRPTPPGARAAATTCSRSVPSIRN